ncbi:hypothetical protein [Pasteurella canis]|uniref:hypothetical protein n=1 Tax=Pasteurella canis TaxID=753 RepID=UPI000E1B9A61|nr:hypothetical protein [Pasteurella canis]
MSKSVNAISNDLRDQLRLKGNNECIMLSWPDFYKVCGRERLADVVTENIKKALQKEEIHIIYGNNVILVRDFPWKLISIN